MSTPETLKRRPGRPKKGKTRVIPNRIPENLARRVELFAEIRGVSRNQAMIQLIERGLENVPMACSCGYNPRTGEYE